MVINNKVMTGSDIVVYRKKHNLTQQEFANLVGVSKNTISNYEIGGVIPKSKLPILESILNKFPNIGNAVAVSNTKDDALENLKHIQSRRKLRNHNEGRLINDSSLAPAIQYIVPIPGQAGLRKAFFSPDEYIEENFDKETVLVKPSERAVYYKIEVDGNSMTGVLEPGDWARCEDIPRIYWGEKDVFKPNKVYCLFHRKNGILFKRISKVNYGTITLSSDNSNKIDYPDQDFDLMEFSKIMIVKKVEKYL